MLIAAAWGLGALASAQGLPKLAVRAVSWDGKGYMPYEATGRLPDCLHEGIRLLREGKSRSALPILRDYQAKNPRDYRAIGALVEAAKALGQTETYYQFYRRRAAQRGASLQDAYGFVRSSLAMKTEMVRDDSVLFQAQVDRLWLNRIDNLGPTIVTAFLLDDGVMIWLWRERMDRLAQENPKDPYVALLRGVNYLSGYRVFQQYDPKKRVMVEAREPRSEPKYADAMRIFRRVRRDHPSWALPTFFEALSLAMLKRPNEATPLFRLYLKADPPADSRQARKARAYLADPKPASFWLPEELEEMGVKSGRSVPGRP